jgi:hypothetical protein
MSRSLALAVLLKEKELDLTQKQSSASRDATEAYLMILTGLPPAAGACTDAA